MDDLSRELFDLSGDWHIRFDPDEVGVQGGWTSGEWPESQTKPIHVPGVWNVTYPEADGVGFYRTVFSPPTGWAGKVVLLRFEGAIYRCEAWLNGTFVGSHEGGYDPFEFDVTQALRPKAENILIVRIAALSKNRRVDGMSILETPVAKQAWYYPFGGIWGKVTLETRPWTSIDHAWVTPDLQGETASLDLGLHNRGAESRLVDLDLTVWDPHGRIAFQEQKQVASPPGQAQYALSLSLPRPVPWSCERPALYRLDVAARSARGEADFQSVSFGMRDFTVRDGQFFLNGEPFYVRGVLFQPYYPGSLIQSGDDLAEIARDVALVKEAGFNLIRTHLNSTPPGLLDLTDRMGVLVYAETSLAWIKDSPRLTDHGQREIKALIERDRNHPSVVFWGIYNENPPMDAKNGGQLAFYARSLDPTRVIVRNSGGSLAIDQDFGWIERGRVIPARETSQQPILDVHLYLGALLPNPIYDWVRRLGSSDPSISLADQGYGSIPVFEEFDRQRRETPGKVFVSELGCGALCDLDAITAGFGDRDDLVDARDLFKLRDDLHRGFAKHGLEQVFGSISELYRQAQDLQAAGDVQQIEAVLTNPRTSGFVLTQWNDAAWESNAGLLDLWRRPKPAYAAVKRLNQPHCLVLRLDQPVVAQGNRVEADLTLINQTPLEVKSHARVRLCDPEGHVIAEEILEAPALPGIHALGKIKAPVGDLEGTYTLQAAIRCADGTIAETEDTVLALKPVAWDALPLGVRFLGSIHPAAVPFSAVPPMAAAGRPMVVAPVPESLLPAEWEDLFSTVEAGGAAVLGALRPEDQAAQRELKRRGMPVRIHPGAGSWLGCHHWIPRSDLFAGLPCDGLAGKPYVDVAPRHILVGLGGEVLAGSVGSTQPLIEDALAIRFYSDIETISLGKGTLTFCQYRLFDHLAGNPLAEHLLLNLLQIIEKQTQF